MNVKVRVEFDLGGDDMEEKCAVVLNRAYAHVGLFIQDMQYEEPDATSMRAILLDVDGNSIGEVTVERKT